MLLKKNTHKTTNPISVTFRVLNDDKLRVANEEHPLNIHPISVTFRVLKDDKLSLVKEEQE